MTATRPRLVAEALTDVGLRRPGNEDNFLADAEALVFAVADGMGGHAAGEVASRIAVDAIREVMAGGIGGDWPFGFRSDLPEPANRLRTALLTANRRVLEASRDTPECRGMASTVAALHLDGDTAHVAHAGDSRVYLLRGGTLTQLTADHSWVGERMREGVLTANEARHHPFRNMVTRALGGRGDLEVELTPCPLLPGDTLLLCSDGLTNMVSDARIGLILDGCDVREAAHELVQAALDGGGDDNITVVVVRLEGD